MASQNSGSCRDAVDHHRNDHNASRTQHSRRLGAPDDRVLEHAAVDEYASPRHSARNDRTHIFFEHDQVSSSHGEPRTPHHSLPIDGRRRVSGMEYARSIGASSVDTPTASSTTNTIVASTASSVTYPDDSEVEYVQRRPSSVDTARLDQMQLLSDFLEMHFPSPAAKADLANRSSYLLGLPEADLSSAPMLRNAIQAICFAHAGANYKDQRLIQESQKAYGKVLGALVRSLDQSGARNNPRIIIPSIMLLTLYDDALPDAKAVSSGWRAHYWGVHDYLKACGPAAFQMSDPFSRMLFVNVRVPNIFLGITRRKAIVLSEPQRRALGNQLENASSPLARLYQRAMHLPGLLEQADIVLSKKRSDSDDGKQIMKGLMALRAEFITWSMAEASFSDKSKKHHESVNAADDEAFDFGIEEHLVMSSNTTFETYFNFSSYKIAQDYGLYWMFALIVDCTLLRLMHFRPHCEAHIKPRRQAETQRDAVDRARYLCRSAYFFAKFDSQGITAWMDTLVVLAESLFSETSELKELGWCQSVLVATKLRLQRLRTKQPETLCRMGDMVDDMAASTRFRSRYLPL